MARPRSKGDLTILAKPAATMVDFDPRFEVLPGTKARGEKSGVVVCGAGRG